MIDLLSVESDAGVPAPGVGIADRQLVAAFWRLSELALMLTFVNCAIPSACGFARKMTTHQTSDGIT